MAAAVALCLRYRRHFARASGHLMAEDVLSDMRQAPFILRWETTSQSRLAEELSVEFDEIGG